jgi:STE24 endopeptidase
MSSSIIFYIILSLFIAEFVLTRILAYLNTLNWSTKLPKKLKEIYDEKEYKKSMEYEKKKHHFSLVSSAFSFLFL